MIVPLEIKSQKETDFCGSCVISSIAEEIIKEPCEESYLAAAAKKISGEPLKIRGISPGNLITAVIRYGVLSKKHAPFSTTTHERDFLVDWNNWKDLERYAIKPYRSAVRVRGFDEAIRQMQKHNTSLMCGIYWQAHWTTPDIETLGEFNKLSPHEVRILGAEDDKLILQNSRGIEKGEGGIFRLGRNAFPAVHHMYRLSQEDAGWFTNLINKI